MRVDLQPWIAIFHADEFIDPGRAEPRFRPGIELQVAVVADEVRSLAQRSAAAAKETAEKIDAAIISSKNGSQCSAKVGEALSEIAEKVRAADLLVADIARAASEQAQGIEQINGAMAQMDKVTQSNAASAEESASASEELSAQAFTQRELVAELQQLVSGSDATNRSSDPAAPQRDVLQTRPYRSPHNAASAAKSTTHRALTYRGTSSSPS